MKIGRFTLSLSFKKIEIETPIFRIRLPDVGILSFATFLSILSFAITSRLNLVVAYNDARAHMNMARLVYDNLKPGFVQIGSVWLPLDHILKLAFVWNDYMWQSGFAGAIWSMVAYIGSAYVIYKLILRITQDRSASFLGMLLFATNLNVLYMQSTPMTELLLLFFFTCASYFLYIWSENKKSIYLVPTALSVFFATLTRYDGWFLFIFVSLSLVFVTFKGYLKTKSFKKIQEFFFHPLEKRLIIFATLGGLGIVLWFVWNLLIFGDPLFFALGPYSAKTQQNRIASSGSLLTKYDIFLSLKAYWHAMNDNVGFVLMLIAIAGFILYFLRYKIKDSAIAVYSLLSPFVFHVISLFIGFSVLVVPELGTNFTQEAQASWFNVRYGLMMIPAVAFFAAYLTKRRWWMKILLLFFIILQSYIFISTNNVITITDGVIGTSALDVTDVKDWLVANTKDKEGLILASISYHNALAFSTGMPLKRFIHEGTGRYWEESLVDPTIYAKWIVVTSGDVGDPVYSALYNKRSGVFLKYYDLKLKAKHINVFERRQFPKDIVTRYGYDLILNGKLFRFIGVNSYDLAYRNRLEIDETINSAGDLDISVLRFWAFGEGIPDGFQPKPYEYNDFMFNKLSYIISSAEKKKMKLIVTFSNFWPDYGGVPQYIKWANQDKSSSLSEDDFFTNDKTNDLYKSYVKKLLTYKNPYTGRLLKDEPAILAWELMNEPRASHIDKSAQVVKWTDEMTAYIKNIDNLHLVSDGTEGFTQGYNDYNNAPSLLQIASLESIDLTSGHYYLGNDIHNQYQIIIDQWSKEAIAKYRKPFIVGEIGFDKRLEKSGGISRENLLNQFLDYSYRKNLNGVILWNWALKIDESFGISPYDPKDEKYRGIIKKYAQQFTNTPQDRK
ncbi:hypothetical protein A3D77_04545 [Candidatus Gottesmanbacteria bacterium RIFCSPHIGHO2_02_FULL_39_11]|uniref:mannan endo-1,4-beta-mannosidase n=1 Tax=Candidatus Gottesmanbacteria bacterium RIFCSPHIGHO2_02_FULL_39_11 TaxID=1798382 RepID=A0A1F5ZJK7_9BACT|nr:MAG: hypothetical protein A3D77_04545 [Candidatus Gottesmanbacteria bacterium RIFCSPHIGHO2_02_FULL_39_11]